MIEKQKYTPDEVKDILSLAKNTKFINNLKIEYTPIIFTISALLEVEITPDIIITALDQINYKDSEETVIESSKYKYKQIRNRNPLLEDITNPNSYLQN